MIHTDDKIEELYKTQMSELYLYAYHMIGNQQEAEDIVQETFCLALGKRDKFLNHPNQKGWLMVVVKNKLFEISRERKNHASLSLDEAQEIENEESQYKEIELEQTALRIMSREEWNMVKDHTLGKATVGELAKRYGITENNMRVRLHRLRRKVQEALT